MSDAIRPSAAWYWAATCLAVVAVGVFLLLAMSMLGEMAELFDLEVAAGPRDFEVAVDEAGPYTVYAQIDRRAESSSKPFPERSALMAGLRLEVVDEAGTSLELRAPEDTALGRNDVGYVPLWGFAATRPGRLQVKAAWTERGREEAIVLAVGKTMSPDDVGGFAGRVGLLVLVMLVGGGAALAIFLVTFTRRRDAIRRLEADAVARLLGDAPSA